MKKVLLSVTALLLCIFLLTGTAEASGYTITGSCGENLTFFFSDGTLTISGTGDMRNFSSSLTDTGSQPWGGWRNDIKTVVLEPGVTSIGDGAFDTCLNLSSITIPDSVTYIGSLAFFDCFSLTSISIPDGVTTIGELAFFQCSDLTSVNIPASLTVIDYSVFRYCSSLTSITIPDSITTIGDSAFDNCTGLTSLIIPDSVTSIGEGAFSGCSSLTSINIPDGITTIGMYMFSGCKSLTDITIPKSVTRIDYGGFDSSGLTSITIPESVTHIGEYAFEGCVGLTSVTIPESVTSIGRNTFNNCSNLASVTLPDSITTIIDGMFRNCTSLNSITIPNSVTLIGGYAFYGCTGLTTLTIPSSVTKLGGNVITNCSNLTSIVIPNTITELSWQSLIGADNLEDIYFAGDASDWNTLNSWQNSLPEVDYLHLYCGNPTGHWTSTWLAGSSGQEAYTADICPCGYEKNKQPAGESGVTRLAGSNRFETATTVAYQMLKKQEGGKFEAIILANGYNFADALSGSYLASVKNIPILLTWNGKEKYNYLNEYTVEYIEKNLVDNGLVYILGGTSAVPESVRNMLPRYRIKRLAGENRMETNLLILKEAGVKPGDEILVCTATGFADSLSASATGKPILLVHKNLTDSQKAYLETLSGNSFCILGGENAVSKKLSDQVGAYGSVSRLAGANRFETSVLVAQKYFTNPDSAVLAYAADFPDGLCGGPLAYTKKAPLILATSKQTAQSKAYFQSQNIHEGIVLGGDSLFTLSDIDKIFN